MAKKASVRRRGQRRRGKMAAELLRGTLKLRTWNVPAVKCWTHRGLTCTIHQGPTALGFYNGYVAVPPEHPYFRKDYDKTGDLSVHGGLTYAGLESDGWVFGFDTGHAGDVWPGQKQPEYMKDWPGGNREWTLELLEAEVNRLADQLVDAQDGT